MYFYFKQQMGLTRCADNKIGCGGTKMGISGGEAKRLSFACEVSITILIDYLMVKMLWHNYIPF